MDNNEDPKGRTITTGNWILLFILSLLIGGVLYNVWSLVKALEVSLPGT